MARRVTGEAGTGDLVGLKEAVDKKEMTYEETLGLKEVGVLRSTGTPVVKTGK